MLSSVLVQCASRVSRVTRATPAVPARTMAASSSSASSLTATQEVLLHRVHYFFPSLRVLEDGQDDADVAAAVASVGEDEKTATLISASAMFPRLASALPADLKKRIDAFPAEKKTALQAAAAAYVKQNAEQQTATVDAALAANDARAGINGTIEQLFESTSSSHAVGENVSNDEGATVRGAFHEFRERLIAEGVYDPATNTVDTARLAKLESPAQGEYPDFSDDSLALYKQLITYKEMTPVSQFYRGAKLELLKNKFNITTDEQIADFLERYEISAGHQTLEWAHPSPPPPHTYDELPMIKEIA